MNNRGDGRIRYLLAIYEISRQKDRVKSIDVANALAVTRASVHNMMQVLTMDGLVTKDHYGEVILTEAGIQEAAKRYEQYRFIYRMFADVLGIPPEEARVEAIIFLTAQAEDTAERFVNAFDTVRANS